MDGLLLEVLTQTVGSETTAAVAASGTTIPIENPTDFGALGGQIMIAETVYDYIAVDSDASTITLATGLVDAVPAYEPIFVLVGGQQALDYYAQVDMGQDTGDPILVPLKTREARLAWPVRVYDPPLPVTVAPGQESITQTHGTTSELDPGYIATGTLAATTAISAGDPNGKRVVMDGTGTPAFEAYDASNVQTVNIDGENNYMTGTLATAQSGPRVEVGQGEAFTFPAEEVRFYSGNAAEDAPGTISALDFPDGLGYEGRLALNAPDFGLSASVFLTSRDASSEVLIQAQDVTFQTPSGSALQVDSLGASFFLSGAQTVDISGILDHATMGSGSVGTGTFRDSVDARVTAVARVFSGASGTGAAAVSKSATISGYTPAAGDTLALTLTNGNSVASPTLNINGGGAKAIKLGGATLDLTGGTSSAGAVWALRYDGTSWHLAGAQQAGVTTRKSFAFFAGA